MSSHSPIIASPIIAPFYIMQYNDPSTKTYFGYIGTTTTTTTTDHNWKVTGLFYAFSPMIRPIPTGLKFINAKKMGKYPWGTKNIKHAYDPFNIQKDAVSFMTWTQPVPLTVPLYLHITPNQTSYPSFDQNPPGNPDGWTQNKLSPLYVLETVLHTWKTDVNNRPIFRFKGSDNRCIPDVNGVTMEECFMMTEEDILHINDNYGPTTLLTRLKLGKDERPVGNFLTGLQFMIVVSLFILSLIACVIVLIN
jgi:hypothetical protein